MQYAWLTLSPFLPKKSQIIPLRLIIPSPSHQPHPTSLRVQTNGTESQEHQQQRPPSLLPLLMGRCDVPEARKGAEDKETPLSLSLSRLSKEGAKERGGRKASSSSSSVVFSSANFSRWRERNEQSILRLTQSQLSRGFLTRKEGSNMERDGERLGEKER